MVKIATILGLALTASCAVLFAPALLLADEAVDGRLRLRAREHFEELAVSDQGVTQTYRGFTNTLDLWYERPYRYSIGLAAGPLFAFLYTNHPLPGFGSDVRFVHLGGEGKLFPAPDLLHLYTRVGVYKALLTTNGSEGSLNGISELVGVGYEFDLGGIGLAPEMAWRWAQLNHGVRVAGTAPAIGLHFYKAI